jgi:uncharacterized protein
LYLHKFVAIIFDPAKRARALEERGLDFADAEQVSDGLLIENPDDRQDYGEERFITVGFLNERMVVVVWTPRGEDRHIISMRKANDREQKKYREQLGGS